MQVFVLGCWKLQCGQGGLMLILVSSDYICESEIQMRGNNEEIDALFRARRERGIQWPQSILHEYVIRIRHRAYYAVYQRFLRESKSLEVFNPQLPRCTIHVYDEIRKRWRLVFLERREDDEKPTRTSRTKALYLEDVPFEIFKSATFEEWDHDPDLPLETSVFERVFNESYGDWANTKAQRLEASPAS